MRLLLTATGVEASSGRDVVAQVARGWRAVNPQAEITALPATDGDAGLLDAVEVARGGVVRRIGIQCASHHAQLPSKGEIAVVTVGSTTYLQTRDVLGQASEATPSSARSGTSYGVGELVLAAISAGARRVVLGTGTPATLDAGIGLLRSLAGEAVRNFDVTESVTQLPTLVARARERLAAVELIALAPAQVPARGLRGAAAQLTASLGPEVSQELDTALAPMVAAYSGLSPHRRDLLAGAPSSASLLLDPAAGTGGGLGLAVSALGGRIVAGPAFMARECELSHRSLGCDLVVVCGERVDPLEASSGVLGAVAAAVAPHGVAVLALGRIVQLDRRNAAHAAISATGTLVGSLEQDAQRFARAWQW